MSLSPGEVTQFLRDYAEFNILLDEVQFTQEDIDKAIEFTTARYDAITPVSTTAADNFPNKYLMLIGVCAHLMQSEAFLQMRNQATYRDGDVENIGVDDKAALYTQVADKLSAEWRATAQQIKVQQNMESAYGNMSSGYAAIPPGYRR